MKTYNNVYAQKIYLLITPIIGETMADASLHLHCKKIGITVDTLQKKDLQAFSESLIKGLVLFVGSDGARQIAQKIVML